MAFEKEVYDCTDVCGGTNKRFFFLYEGEIGLKPWAAIRILLGILPISNIQIIAIAYWG